MDYTPLPFRNAFPIAPPGARTLYLMSHPRTYKKFYYPVFGCMHLLCLCIVLPTSFKRLYIAVTLLYLALS